MQDLVPLGAYELLTNHSPPPVDTLVKSLASPHAQRTYQAVLEHYLTWIERDPFAADRNAISNYKAEMLINHRPSSVALRLRIVAELYDLAISMGLTSRNPTAGVAPPAFSVEGPCVPPSPDEARARLPLCRQAREECRRDRALCLLVMHTDVTPENVCALRVKDLVYEGEGCFLTTGSSEGNKRERLALPDAISGPIDEYLANREVADDSPLFVLSALGPVAARLALPLYSSARRAHIEGASPLD